MRHWPYSEVIIKLTHGGNAPQASRASTACPSPHRQRSRSSSANSRSSSACLLHTAREHYRCGFTSNRRTASLNPDPGHCALRTNQSADTRPLQAATASTASTALNISKHLASFFSTPPPALAASLATEAEQNLLSVEASITIKDDYEQWRQKVSAELAFKLLFQFDLSRSSSIFFLSVPFPPHFCNGARLVSAAHSLSLFFHSLSLFFRLHFLPDHSVSLFLSYQTLHFSPHLLPRPHLHPYPHPKPQTHLFCCQLR